MGFEGGLEGGEWGDGFGERVPEGGGGSVNNNLKTGKVSQIPRFYSVNWTQYRGNSKESILMRTQLLKPNWQLLKLQDIYKCMHTDFVSDSGIIGHLMVH